MGPKLGVVGVGTFGINHLRAFRQLEREGHAELAAAAELDDERRGNAETEYGVTTYRDHREMLAREKLDAVTVVTPDFAHREVALDALRAGCHVLVEKPLDVTVEGCQAIIAEAQARSLLLQVDFHKRYDPYHLELHRLVRAGKLGQPLYGYVHMEDRIEVPRDWFPSWAPQSSPAWFLGVHFYDLLRWVLSSDARSVFARGQKTKLTGLGIDTYDSVQAQVEFDNGAVVTFDTSWILPDGFEAIVNQGLRLVGTEGVIEVDSQDRGARSCLSEDGGMRTYNLGFMREETDRGGQAVYQGYGIESIADFAENVAFILDGGSLADLAGRYPDGHDGLEVTRIACAVEKSIAAGRVVEIAR
jgi:predicted dehydrogenase